MLLIVVVAAKTTSDASKCSPFPPDPNSSSSTINTVVREITEAGGEASAIQLDVRDFGEIQSMVDQTAEKYGRIDVLVYNSGAIWWSSVEKTPMKRFQLMQRINPEGFYGCVQACLPYMYQNGGKGKGRIVVVSPPIYRRFLKGKTAYAMGKWAMSALTMGLSVDFEREERTEMAITSLWTGAVRAFSIRLLSNHADYSRASIRQRLRVRKLIAKSFANPPSSPMPFVQFSKRPQAT